VRQRLQKVMAKAGIGSRRHNETLIRAGKVRVNGTVAKIGDSADLSTDKIEVDGREISIMEPLYIMVNKPKGVLSSTEDELGLGRPTVRDMIALEGHIYPVGRLDKQSEGLMLLTNDGEIAHRLTHPRFGHEKVYRVALEGHVPPTTIGQWREGVDLDGRTTAPADVEVLSQSENTTWLRITMREGRKRQIRRIASMLGYPVSRLIREQIGPLRVGDLERGAWRHLDHEEVASLHRAAQRDVTERRTT
jgi:23S rRNA pseudouridine2605 synthase